MTLGDGSGAAVDDPAKRRRVHSPPPDIELFGKFLEGFSFFTLDWLHQMDLKQEEEKVLRERPKAHEAMNLAGNNQASKAAIP